MSYSLASTPRILLVTGAIVKAEPHSLPYEVSTLGQLIRPCLRSEHLMPLRSPALARKLLIEGASLLVS